MNTDCANTTAVSGSSEQPPTHISVHSVADFVSKISDIHQSSIHTLTPSVSSMTFYRGQADAEWTLTPTLYRNGLFDKESVLLSELKRLAPEAFSGMTYFDVLVKMQHYGLPTRLLDMTQNPLIALYFACADPLAKGRDGAVHIFPQLPVFRQESGAVRIILKYAFEYSGLDLDIERFLQDIQRSGEINGPHEITYASESDILHLLTKVPFHAVLPSMTNERIGCQAGAFMLFGMTLKNVRVSKNPGNLERRYLQLRPLEGEKEPTRLWKPARVLLIPRDIKARILQDLALVGVSNYRIFPELDHKARYVTELVRSGDAPTRSLTGNSDEASNKANGVDVQ